MKAKEKIFIDEIEREKLAEFLAMLYNKQVDEFNKKRKEISENLARDIEALEKEFEERAKAIREMYTKQLKAEMEKHNENIKVLQELMKKFKVKVRTISDEEVKKRGDEIVNKILSYLNDVNVK